VRVRGIGNGFEGMEKTADQQLKSVKPRDVADETIASGSGAGKHWEGTSGVHTHMTNTRITNAEVFERRYPVILREFSLRAGICGKGQHKGGDGGRDIEFRIPVQLSILSERRVYHPYGLHGGEDAQCG
jgi:5-oxoprolinase (ATP-hydrolysing)